MRYLIIIGLLSLCLSTFSQVNSYPCPDNTTTTNPDITNGYDWRIDPLDFWRWDNNQSVHVTNVMNPFFSTTNLNVAHLATLSQDFNPNDGWELLYTKIGDPPPASNDVTHPIIVLYNKYNAIMRVFLLVVDRLQDYDKASIYLSWDQSAGSSHVGNALLSLHSTPTWALDNYNQAGTFQKFVKPNYFSNDNYYWLYGDFPLLFSTKILQELPIWQINN